MSTLQKTGRISTTQFKASSHETIHIMVAVCIYVFLMIHVPARNNAIQYHNIFIEAIKC